jgi:hypothetical protein
MGDREEASAADAVPEPGAPVPSSPAERAEEEEEEEVTHGV